MPRWVLIAGDLSPLGGMDRANHALASFLVRRGDDVTLVTHRAWPDLSAAGARVRSVRRPLGSHLLGAPLLGAAGRRVAARASTGTRVIANGGNAATGDIVWVHYLHGVWDSQFSRGVLKPSALRRTAHHYFLSGERRAISGARVVVCNSRRTARDVQRVYGLPLQRLRVVHYGTDGAAFPLVDDQRRASARRDLGWDDGRVALFIGALGDHRKGFDRLFEAWRILSRDPHWDVALGVAGSGADLARWKSLATRHRMSNLRFLGFRDDIAHVMTAADVVVHPARYEPYGLAVHEALCMGLPAIVTRAAGVAEMYPPDLDGLLLDDVESAEGIAGRIRRWRDAGPELSARMRTLSKRLRARSWDDMAAEFVQAVGE